MEQKEEKKTYKLFNSIVLTIYTIITLLISFTIYEVFYCNSELFVTENANYFFSMSRIAFYIVVLTLFVIFRKHMIEPAIDVANNSKLKRIAIYVYIPLMLLGIIAFYIRLFSNLSLQSILRVTLGAITLLSSSLFLIYVSKDHVKNIILASLTFGIIFSISTEYYHALDEKKHFLSAFNLASFNINYELDPVNNNQFESIEHRLTGNDFVKFYTIKYDNTVEPNTNLEDTSSTPTTYSRFLYLFSAVGIFLSKTLGGSVADVFVAGRIFNLLFYTLMMCIAIKILPFKRNVFTAVALMPMVLLLAASYSIDSSCLALVSIFVAYVLKVYTMDEIKLKNWGIMVALFLLMLTAKSMAYLAVGAIIFILPLWKIIKNQNKKVKIAIAVLAVILCVMLIVVLFYIKNNLISTDVRGGGEVDSHAQMEYIMNNPFNIAILEFNYINNSLLSFGWLAAMHQGAFFTLTLSGSTFLIIMAIIGYISITDDSYNFNKKEKIIFITTFLIVYFMTNIILYICFTPVGDTKISGYQARYLFPILPLLLICVSNNKIKIIKDENRNYLIMLILGIIIMIGVIEEILMGRP